jgi:putative membrane protein
MFMRTANFFGFVSASLVVMLLTLAPGFARAADNQPLDPEEQAFLTRAMSDNATQVAMARLALQKSQNQQVIDLANTVIQERMALDEKLAPLLGNDIAAPKLATRDNANLTALQTLNGQAFDKSFAGLLVRDHNEIISAYECIKATASNPALRSVVHDTVPQLQGNLMVALIVLRSANWAPTSHQQQLSAVDTHTTKMPVFMGESLSSIVTAPW